MSRLFLAIWPPEEVVADLTQLRRKDQRGVRFVPPENWHITLRFLGEAHPDEVIAALDAVRFGPARLCVGPAVDVLADRALVLPVSGAEQLAADLATRTAHIGEPPRQRFVGHLTLARLKPRATMPTALGALYRAEFDVDEVALVRSRLEPDGARYESIEWWPLG
jgi:2'-5' RNA ligase